MKMNTPESFFYKMQVSRLSFGGFRYLAGLCLCLLLNHCGSGTKQPPTASARQYTSAAVAFDTLRFHATVYVPVYAEILYNYNADLYQPLLTTLSIRNTSMRNSLYVRTVDYYNTEGNKLKSFITRPIILRPLQSVEFPVTYKDEGGGGANFIVEWGSTFPAVNPLIQSVSVGVVNRLDFSWVTNGVIIDSSQSL